MYNNTTEPYPCFLSEHKKCKSPQEQEKLKSKSSDSVLYQAGVRRTLLNGNAALTSIGIKFVQLTGYNESHLLDSHTTGRVVVLCKCCGRRFQRDMEKKNTINVDWGIHSRCATPRRRKCTQTTVIYIIIVVMIMII